MPFLTDFASAITGYPAASVTLTIGSLVVQPPGTTPAVNINEVWAFTHQSLIKTTFLLYKSAAGAITAA